MNFCPFKTGYCRLYLILKEADRMVEQPVRDDHFFDPHMF